MMPIIQIYLACYKNEDHSALEGPAQW